MKADQRAECSASVFFFFDDFCQTNLKTYRTELPANFSGLVESSIAVDD